MSEKIDDGGRDDDLNEWLMIEDDEQYEREPECFHCGDSGRIVAADGYHEYLGYNYLPCPHCSAGVNIIPDGPHNPFWQ